MHPAITIRLVLTGPSICLIYFLIFFGSERVYALENEFDFSTRLRYADLLSGSNEGKSSSALLRFSLKTDWSKRIGSFVELDHVETALEDQHSDGKRFNGEPLIPDVEGTEFNQLFFGYKTRDVTFKLGRQVIELDNQRFIGSVRFWQNEQSFDAAFVTHHLFSNSQINYGYIHNANRIFGDDARSTLNPEDINFLLLNGLRPASQLGDHKHNTHILRLEFNEWDYSQLVVFSYLIDNEDVPAVSNNTFGLNYHFNYKPRHLRYRVELDTASQNRPELSNAENIPYLRFEFGLGLKSFEISGQYELLGSKNNISFATPLGSLHEFHGWADRLNTAPDAGLIDQLLSLKWRRAPWKFDIRGHQFNFEDNRQSIGRELDFDIALKIGKKHEVLLRFANFVASRDEEDRLSDNRRAMLNYSYNF